MTRANQRRTISVMIATLVLACGCFGGTSTLGVRLPKTPRFLEEWRRYEQLQPSKALAVAGDVDALYVSGYAFGYPDDADAVKAAMAACEARRIDRRVAVPCRTYAVGDRLSDTAGIGLISRR